MFKRSIKQLKMLCTKNSVYKSFKKYIRRKTRGNFPTEKNQMI